MRSELLYEKLIVMFSMLVVTFLFGMMPLKIFSSVRDNTDVTARIRFLFSLSVKIFMLLFIILVTSSLQTNWHFFALGKNMDHLSKLGNCIFKENPFRWRLVMSFASCFAGGVFIGACLLDLVPDVEENIQQVSIMLIDWLLVGSSIIYLLN